MSGFSLKDPFNCHQDDILSMLGWKKKDDNFINKLDDLVLLKKTKYKRIIEALDKLKGEYSQRLSCLPDKETSICRERITVVKSFAESLHEQQTFSSTHEPQLDDALDEVYAIKRQLSEIESTLNEKQKDFNIDENLITISLSRNGESESYAEASFKYSPWCQDFPPKLLTMGSFIQELLSESSPEKEPEDHFDFESFISDDKSFSIEDFDNFDVLDSMMSPGTSTPVNEIATFSFSIPTESSGAIPKSGNNLAPKSENNLAPKTWSQMAKENCPVSRAAATLPRPERIVGETNRPHCFLDVSIKNEPSKRVVIRLRPDKAPYMCQNFIQLCMGTKGYGYKGCKIFRALPNNHIVAGDFEKNNGSGGYSALDEKLFTAEHCPLRDKLGALRMRGIERTPDGRCKVGSQFMIWVGEIEFKTYKHTLVFGNVTEGLPHLRAVSEIGSYCSGKDLWLMKSDVVIVNSGVL